MSLVKKSIISSPQALQLLYYTKHENTTRLYPIYKEIFFFIRSAKSLHRYRQNVQGAPYSRVDPV